MIRDWINPLMLSTLSTDPIPLSWVDGLTETEWYMAMVEKINSIIADIKNVNVGNREYVDFEIDKTLHELENVKESLSAKHNTDVAKLQKQLSDNYTQVLSDMNRVLDVANKCKETYGQEHGFLETFVHALFEEYKKSVFDIIEYKSGDKIRVFNPVSGQEQTLNRTVKELYDMKSPWNLTVAELEKLTVEVAEKYSIAEIETDGRLNLWDEVYKLTAEEIASAEIEPSEFYELKTVVTTILETCENLKMTMSQLADNNTLLNKAVADLRKRG